MVSGQKSHADRRAANTAQRVNFKRGALKFGEILNKTQSAGSEKFALTTEIRKQILDILSLDYRALASFIQSFKTRLNQFISDLEAA